MRLKGKVSVITGGNSGIGFGIAQAFQREGATGVITGRNEATLNQSIQHLGSGFTGIICDVTSNRDLEQAFEKASWEFGKIDVLVVNAGGIVDGVAMGPITEIDERSFDKYIELNLKSVYFTVKNALPYLNDHASIILIGSTSGHRAAPGMAVYSAAKAAVISLAKGLSLDLLQRKIRVNVLSPGTTDTPAFDKFIPEQQVRAVKQKWVDLIPAGRIGQPSDLGNAAVFLASDESSFILGTEILSDGGMTNIGLMD